ncbi:MAG: TraC family protein [Hyphomicrobiaceae bacterium]
MGKPKTRLEADKQIAALELAKRQIIKREQEALGRAAEKAGILDLGLTESELIEVFKTVVERFPAARLGEAVKTPARKVPAKRAKAPEAQNAE